MHLAFLLVQLAAVVITALSWIPQAYRAARAPDRSGISVSAWVQGVVLSGTLSYWALSAHVWSFAVSELAFLLGSALIVGLAAGPRWGLGLLAGALLAVGALSLWVPASVFGLLGVALSLSIRLSQLRRIVRRESSAGVSSGTWIALIVANALWFAVGVGTGEVLLMVGTLGAVLSSLAVEVARRVAEARTRAATEPAATIPALAVA